MNNFLEIVSSPMMSTTNIYRYSGTKMVEPETLSTHILETQMMGYMIINYLNQNCGESLDKGLYLEKALHHDLEETMTGDIVRTVKYHNDNVLHELRVVADEVAKSMYDKYFEDKDRVFYNLWADAKEGKEGFILKLVDTLTVVNRSIREVDFLNNLYFIRVVYEVSIYLEELQNLVVENPQGYTKKSIVYLCSILEGAQEVLRQIMREHKNKAQEYGIIDTSLLKKEESSV